ncbi:MAG: 2Fe-2S iron-sulfur cluster-binding protein [Verrucomicrobiota bacterium]
MQSIINQFQTVVRENIGLSLGLILLGMLASKLLLMLYSSARAIFHEREQRQLSRERLKLMVKAAAAQLREAEQSKALWNGVRKFQIARKVKECEDVFSFYLAPHDGKPLPAFKPGQYLTFQLDVPGRDKPVIRCYSLSDCHRKDFYRVTIKKAVAPPDQPGIPHGIASHLFCDTLVEGDILNVKAPSGHFFLDVNKPTPVVLISGGVGITPMLSMANALLESGSKREIWFFFGARNGDEFIQRDHLLKLAVEHENFHLNVCFSKPRPTEEAGRDYQHAERVSVDLMKKLLPSNNYEYFICGPGAFMKSITDGLETWGVPDSAVFFEAFGPATVKKAAPKVVVEAGAPTIQVNFSRTGKIASWKPQLGSLLDLADELGIKIESGCRAGNCGTCLVAIKSGNVDYVTEHGASSEDGSCLTCICKPKTDLVLDA